MSEGIGVGAIARRPGISLGFQSLNWERLVDDLPVGIYICDAEGCIVQYNDRAAALWGRSPSIGSSDHLIGKGLKACRPESEALAETPMAEVLRTGKPVRGRELVFERPDGSRIFVQANLEPLRDDRGTVIGAVSCFQDISARKEAEHRYKELLQALPAAIYTTDMDGRITFYNDAAVAFAGRQPALGEQWCVTWRLYHPDGTRMPHDQCPMAVALREKQPVRSREAIAERPDGSRIWFMPYPTPLTDSSGVMTGAINMMVDITERKEAERHQKLMVDELNHRVKNTLAAVQSLIAQTAHSVDTVEEFRQVVEARLFAMSCAHDQLSRRSWNDAELSELAIAGLAPYRDKGNVVVSGAPTTIAPRAALMLSMVFHELATNAVKYGALSSPGGKVELGWNVIANGAGPMLRLEWIESGGPAVKPRLRHGFGTKLVERGIELELGGKACLDLAPSGLRCEIELPMDHVV